MKKYWYWIELIGFDAENTEQSVDVFLSRTGGAEGVSLLLFSVDFINEFTEDEEGVLPPQVCSYAAHNSNGERRRQVWTKRGLKKLVSVLRARGLKVLLCVFNMYLYHLDGKEICEGFSSEHLEINELCNDGNIFQVVSMIKTLSDGTSYGEFFTDKLIRAVEFYGFDGVQIADGISSARLPIAHSDFSDDLVGRFIARGGKLPDGAEAVAEFDAEKFKYRAAAIIREKRAEWTEFISTLWSEFVSTLIDKLKSRKKIALVNTAWTRSPAEAYIRYGMDYTSAVKNADALMVEENAQTLSIGGLMHFGGVKADLKRRASLAAEGYIMQLAVKALLPDLPQITMCPVRDNEEQFDTLRHAYTEITKSAALRHLAKVFGGEKFVSVSDNLLYTLSDSITESEWADLHRIEEIYSRAEGEPNGVIAVFSPSSIKRQAEKYFAFRDITDTETYVRLMRAGLSICGGVAAKDVSALKLPLVAACVDLFADDEKRELEKYSYPLFTIGHGRALCKKPCLEIKLGKNSDYVLCGYNLSAAKTIDLQLGAKTNEAEEIGFGTFTAPLPYEKIPDKFFGRVSREIKAIIGGAKLLSGGGCKIAETRRGDKAVYIITNDSYFYEMPTVDTGRLIENAVALSKIDGYKVRIDGTKFSVLVNNRGAEAVEVTFKKP